MEKTDKSKGAMTRERIYYEALCLFSERGVQNVPFQAIADRIGITQAALYKYVSNRDQLLNESILFAAEIGRNTFQLEQLFQSKMSPEKKLLEYFRRNLHWVISDHPYNIAFPALHFYATQVAGLSDVHAIISERRCQVIGQLVAPLVSKKKHHAVVTIIHNLLLGEMMEAYNHKSGESVDEKIKRLAPQLALWWQEN